jgi:hypothetical protein
MSLTLDGSLSLIINFSKSILSIDSSESKVKIGRETIAEAVLSDSRSDILKIGAELSMKAGLN